MATPPKKRSRAKAKPAGGQQTTARPAGGRAPSGTEAVETIRQIFDFEGSKARRALTELGKLTKDLQESLQTEVEFGLSGARARKELQSIGSRLEALMARAGTAGPQAVAEVSRVFSSIMSKSASQSKEAVQEIQALAKEIDKIQAAGNLFDPKESKEALDQFKLAIGEVAHFMLVRPAAELYASVDELQEAIQDAGDFVPREAMDVLAKARELGAQFVQDVVVAMKAIAAVQAAGGDSTKEIIAQQEKLAEKHAKLLKQQEKDTKNQVQLIARQKKAAEAIDDLRGKSDSDKSRPGISDLWKRVNDLRNIRKGQKQRGETPTDEGVGKAGAFALKTGVLAEGIGNAVDIPGVSNVLTGLGKTLGALTTATGGILGVVGAVIGLVKALMSADEKVKEFNASIIQNTAGYTDLADSQMAKGGDIVDHVQKSLRTIRDGVNDVFNGMRMTAEETLKAAASIQQAGATLPKIQAGFGGDLKEAGYVVATYAKLTGQSFEDIGKFIADMHDSLVIPFQNVDDVLAVVTKDMYASALGADKFFSALRNIAIQNRVFGASLLQTSKLLSVMGKSTVMARDDITNLAESFTGLVKGLSLEQRGAMQMFGANWKEAFQTNLDMVKEDIGNTIKELQETGVPAGVIKALKEGKQLTADQKKFLDTEKRKELYSQIRNLRQEGKNAERGAKGSYVTQLAMTPSLRPVIQLEQLFKAMAGGKSDKKLEAIADSMTGERREMLKVAGFSDDQLNLAVKFLGTIEEDLTDAGLYKGKEGQMTLDDFYELLKTKGGEVGEALGDKMLKQEQRQKAQALAAASEPFKEALKRIIEGILLEISEAIDDIRSWLFAWKKPGGITVKDMTEAIAKAKTTTVELSEKAGKQIEDLKAKKEQAHTPAEKQAIDAQISTLEAYQDSLSKQPDIYEQRLTTARETGTPLTQDFLDEINNFTGAVQNSRQTKTGVETAVTTTKSAALKRKIALTQTAMAGSPDDVSMTQQEVDEANKLPQVQAELSALSRQKVDLLQSQINEDQKQLKLEEAANKDSDASKELRGKIRANQEELVKLGGNVVTASIHPDFGPNPFGPPISPSTPFDDQLFDSANLGTTAAPFDITSAPTSLPEAPTPVNPVAFGANAVNPATLMGLTGAPGMAEIAQAAQIIQYITINGPDGILQKMTSATVGALNKSTNPAK